MVTHPNLVFFYSMSEINSKYNKQIIGSTLLAFTNGDIKNKNNTNLGKFAFSNNIYDIDVIKNKYDTVGNVTFFLPKGNIQLLASYKSIKNSEGNFTFPQGKNTYTYKILSGTGQYINATGYAVFNVNSSSLTRKVSIFFTNAPPPHVNT